MCWNEEPELTQKKTIVFYILSSDTYKNYKYVYNFNTCKWIIKKMWNGFYCNLCVNLKLAFQVVLYIYIYIYANSAKHYAMFRFDNPVSLEEKCAIILLYNVFDITVRLTLKLLCNIIKANERHIYVSWGSAIKFYISCGLLNFKLFINLGPMVLMFTFSRNLNFSIKVLQQPIVYNVILAQCFVFKVIFIAVFYFQRYE